MPLKEKKYCWTVLCSSALSLLTWLGVPLFKCSVGAASPKRDLSGFTSGVLLVLLAEDPDMDAWTDATTFACSGGTYLNSKRAIVFTSLTWKVLLNICKTQVWELVDLSFAILTTDPATNYISSLQNTHYLHMLDIFLKMD